MYKKVYCLNTALKLYSSVVVVPVFYGTYTAVGLVNTIIYLDEIGNYPPWAIALVFIGIAVLIYGVALLSSKSDPVNLSEEEELREISSKHWLTEKEERQENNTEISESSGSSSNYPLEKVHQKQRVLPTVFKKIKNLFKRTPLPKREMETFISLYSLPESSQTDTKKGKR